MAHGRLGGPSGSACSDPSIFSSSTSLNILNEPAPRTAFRNDADSSLPANHRQTNDALVGGVSSSISPLGGAEAAPAFNGSTTHDGDSDDANPEAVHGQLFGEFLQSLDEFTPTIPDAVASYYVSSSGFQVDDSRLLRLIGLSCQKFIADVTNDAMQRCKSRMAQLLKNQKQAKPRFQLTFVDLLPALKERGIDIKKPLYYV